MTQTEQLRQELARLVAAKNHLAERFLTQMAFVDGLIGLHPTKAPRWKGPIRKAWEIVGAALASGKADRLEKAVKEAEEALAPLAKTAKSYTVHCVGHAHIDMNWMWSWPETVAVTNDTFTTMLKLMDEFPDFTFSQSQASVYAIARDYNPGLLEQIRRRVAEGRWEVTAAHWVEGDKNLAAGESLARHLLYTRRFMGETFGLKPEDVRVDWEPDTFGHARTIPSIVARGGVKHYYMCRGGYFPKPPVFWWQGPDGSRVLVFLDFSWYNDHIGPHNVPRLLDFCRQTGLQDWMLVYGVGDHGGGPTRRDIIRCRDMNTWPIFPNYRFGTTRDYFPIVEAAGDKLQVLDRELNYEFTGCYTSQSAIKRTNRLGENYLQEAESAATLAYRALGRAYPAQQLRQGWTDTLFGHFHDILPGSGVHWTREYQIGLFQKTSAMTGIVKTHSLRELAAAVDTSFAGLPRLAKIAPERESIALGGGAGRGSMVGGISTAGHVADGPLGVLVFNPSGWDRGEVVTASVWDADTGAAGTDLNKKSFVVKTPDGGVMAAQKTGNGNYWGHNFVDIAFPAQAGALGYSAVVVEEGAASAPAESYARLSGGYRGGEFQPDGNMVLENELILAEFDRYTGGIIRLMDKASGRNLASPDKPLGMLEYVLERPRGMSSWLLADPMKRICPLETETVWPAARGPYVASVEVKQKLNDSRITTTFALRAGQPWLDITVNMTWVERGGNGIGTPALRLQLPLAVDNAAATYEAPFGSVQRDLHDGEEVPALRWADVTGRACGSDEPAGLTLLNDCKYGHSLEGSTLRLTLIRSSYEPDPLPEVGEHTMRMGLVPHAAAKTTAELIKLGAAFNHPLMVVSTDIHKGALPPTAAGVAEVGPANVVLTNVKKAEDEDAVIVRLLETAGEACVAKVAMNPSLMGKVTQAVEVDLLERPVEGGSAQVSGGGFSVRVGAYGIASVKVTLEK